MRDAFGTLWFTGSIDGTRIPVDPEREFDSSWIGHHTDEEER